MANDAIVKEAARKAIDAADFLNLVNAIFLSIALAGAAILAFIGFTAEAESGGEFFIILAIATAVSAIPLFALMRAVATGTHLAGVMANRSQDPLVMEEIIEPPPPAGRARQAISDTGCATCGSRNLRGTQCLRCQGEAVELTSGNGWYVTVDDPSKEQYFDGESWTEEYRDSTRHTLETWDAVKPGWLRDPDDQYLDRFWDGKAWTPQTRDAWGDDGKDST